MMSTSRMTGRLLTALAATAMVWGCGGGETTDDDAASGDASLMEVKITGEGESEEYDLNGDGKPDMTSIFTRTGDPNLPREERDRVLARKEIDVNFDSKTDVKQFYGADGVLVREEMDLDFDAKIDAVDYYVDGIRIRRELFLNFIEQPSMWKYYEEGKLVRKARDTTGNGKADTFEFYDPKGEILRIGYDTKGDGKPDYYEEAGEK